MGGVNISIALTVFMAIASGGLLALVLMSVRRQQTNFSLMLALTLLLAVLGAVGSASGSASVATGLATGLVILILSFALGYILTTYSVLSSTAVRVDVQQPDERNDTVAAILLAPGEPPEYDVRSAARRFEFADDREDVPPALLRPFYMRDLKGKYAAVGTSPARDYYLQLADKVQSRLDSRHKVYAAFYSDQPTYLSAVRQAVEDGARRIVVMHVRVSDPPDSILSNDLLEPFRLESREIVLIHVGPLWDGGLLPQIYVRQVMEAAAQSTEQGDDAGLLLIGRGHQTGSDSSIHRMEQEEAFTRRVRDAILKMGFAEWRVRIAWLRYGEPTVAEALTRLAESGCRVVYWMSTTYIAAGINTDYDIPAQINDLAAKLNVRAVGLDAWNADSLAAQEIASRIKSASGVYAHL